MEFQFSVISEEFSDINWIFLESVPCHTENNMEMWFFWTYDTVPVFNSSMVMFSDLDEA